MSRSYKKINGGGITTAPSDKEYKVMEHRKYRAVIRELIAHCDEDTIFPDYGGKYGDTWGAPKDGKTVRNYSMNSYLKKPIHSLERIGEWRISIWTGKPYRKLVSVVRMPTIGDWKKTIRK